MLRINPTRLIWLYVVLLLSAAFLVRCVLLLYLGPTRPTDIVEFFYDDGYYYLTVAANIADLGRSTFDGLTATNGYQPLWLLLLALLAKAVGTNPHTLFAAACFLVYLIVVGGVVLPTVTCSREQTYIPLCLGVGLAGAVLRWPLAFVQGLESVLLIPLLLMFVVLIERRFSPRQLYLVSGVLAAMFLVRLDALALYAAMLLLLLVPVPLLRPWSSTGPSQVLRYAAKLSIFVLPVVAAYLLINQWLFDSAVPVSGLAKSIGGPKFSNWGVAQTFFGPARDGAFLLALLLPLEWLARRYARPETLFYRSFAVVAAAAIIQCLYFCTQYTWYVMPWYECLVMACAALVIGRIVYLCSVLLAQTNRAVARRCAQLALAIVCLWISLWAAKFADASMPVGFRSALRNSLHLGNPMVAEVRTFNQISLSMLNEFFDSSNHTVIAMGDRAGGIGYWGRRSVSVIQLEGLMLDRRYIEAREQHRGGDYVERSFPIQTFVVDREVIPTVRGTDGQMVYVIADPVRGRITNQPVPTFCFPDSAVRYLRKYVTFTGVNTRMAFDFSSRITCAPAAVDMIRSIEQGIGLQQYSLPSEYDYRGGFADSALEDRDRKWVPTAGSGARPD